LHSAALRVEPICKLVNVKSQLETLRTCLPIELRSTLIRVLDTIDDEREKGTVACTRIESGSEAFLVPDRVYISQYRLQELITANPNTDTRLVCLALGSRHVDGFFRQICVEALLVEKASYVPAFVVRVLGEYVLQIRKMVHSKLEQLDRRQYANYVSSNHAVFQKNLVRSISYWNCYYRSTYSSYKRYPPWLALQELNAWSGEVAT
jgi:hypothetical protein